MGLECAGVVKQVGRRVTQLREGDEVCALLAGGGYAEQVLVPAGQVVSIPRGLNMQQAAALPEVVATAYLNIFLEAKAVKGERVLLHAGASGVGTAAIQLCKVMGNPCFVTAGSQEKIDFCISLGADGGYDRHQNPSDGSFVDAVREWSDGDGADVILDPVGGAYLANNQACLAEDGRLVIIGLMGGVEGNLNLGRMMVKRQRLIGSTLRARSVATKTRLMQHLKTHIWPMVDSGQLKPVVDSVMSITDIEAAHQHVASNSTQGKVVLTIPR